MQKLKINCLLAKLQGLTEYLILISNWLFQGEKPDQWSMGNLIQTPKSGDLS